MFKRIRAFFSNLLGRRSNDTNNIIADSASANNEVQDEPLKVDHASFQKAITGHKIAIPNTITKVFGSGIDENSVKEQIEQVAQETVDDLSKAINGWKKRAIAKAENVKATIQNELSHWTSQKVADRYLVQIENLTSVLKESLKAVYESKVRRGYEVKRLRDEVIKLVAEKRTFLIRHMGDEKAEMKMMNTPLFATIVVAFFGLITALETLLGMPIFRYESNWMFAYAMSAAFAVLLGGFTIISSHHMNRVIAANQAWSNYEHNYDEDHLPTDNNGKIIKPVRIKTLDKILAFGGTTILIIIAIALLTWRVITSFSMEQDGGLGFMSALLLLAVTALMYFADLVIGPKFALAEYRAYDSLISRETELKNEIKSLSDDDITTQQVQYLLQDFNSKAGVVERQIDAEAVWLVDEIETFSGYVQGIEDLIKTAQDHRKHAFEIINESLQREPFAVSPEHIQVALGNDRWSYELDQRLEPVAVEPNILNRFKQFKPEYNLPTDKKLKDFHQLLEESEKEAREKVRKQIAEEQDHKTGGGIVPLKQN